jgi:hypothetical protein
LIAGGAGEAAASARAGVALEADSPALAPVVDSCRFGSLGDWPDWAALGGRGAGAIEVAARAIVDAPEAAGSEGGLCADARGSGWRSAPIPEIAIDVDGPGPISESLNR